MAVDGSIWSQHEQIIRPPRVTKRFCIRLHDWFCTNQRKKWFEYSNLQSMALAYRPEEVMPALERIERLVNTEHLTAAGFVIYEAASGFDAALATQDAAQLPLICFGLFAEVTECKPPLASAIRRVILATRYRAL